MKDYKFEMKVKETTYNLVFNLNVMEELQEEFGSIEKWGKLTDGSNGEVNVKALKFGLTAMINEGIEIENEENGTDRKLLTEKQVGRIITEIGLENAVNNLNSAVIESTKTEIKN